MFHPIYRYKKKKKGIKMTNFDTFDKHFNRKIMLNHDVKTVSTRLTASVLLASITSA